MPISGLPHSLSTLSSLIAAAHSPQISYTFGRLIPTLLIIESPDALFEPLPTIDPDAPLDPNAPAEQEVTAIKQKPITSSFRKTLKHLQSKGGYPARFRGFALYLVYSILFTIISAPLSAIPIVGQTVGIFVASILLANVSLAWTHIVISEPSAKPWFRRIPGLQAWKKIAVPTAVFGLATQLASLPPLILAKIFGLNKLKETGPDMTSGQQGIVALEGFAIAVLSLVLFLVLVLPANVMLTRVQASLLDDAEETIVPFDRSFGGKVVPEIVGGGGVISMRDAWNTFDWASRFRLVKAYAKLILLHFLVWFVFIIVVVIEILLIARLDPQKIFPGKGEKGGDSEI
jgi:hypothetical protein